MEIKILCVCGSKFKFDVEPVNGRSPGVVHCPVCGKDSTEMTNALIQERLTSSAPTAQPPSVPAAAPKISIGIPNSGGPKVSIPSIAPSATAPTAAPTPLPPVAPPKPVASAGAGHSAPSPSGHTPAALPPQSAGPMNPKVAFMPVPAAGGTKLSVSGKHGKKDEEAGTPPPPPLPPNP